MRKFVVAAAAIAMTATMANADPGKGNGNGNGKNGASENSQKATGNSGGENRGNQKAQDRKPEKAQNYNSGAKNVQAKNVQKAEKSASSRQANGPAYKSNAKADAKRDRVNTSDRGDYYGRNDRDDRNQRIRNANDMRDGVRFGEMIDGCPPGLAKKRNGCTPPGLAKKGAGGAQYYQPGYFGYSSLGNGRYLYDQGYLLRMGNNGGVSSYIPLLGGALSLGSAWPTNYQSYQAPDYYVDYYNLGGQDSYRYADNVIYRVDPETTAISSIVALLTGDDFSIGQRAPSGYDVYNVPTAYRDRYYDTPQANYRYSDGYVYQIDPKTQLVAAAIELIL